MGLFDMVRQGVQSVGDMITHPNHDALPPGSSSPVQAGGLTMPGLGGIFDGIKQTVGDIGRGVSQEGLGGLLDPRGMMDRQAAQRELADRFQVVGDDFKGPRAPNTVSQEEYQRIARTYSDIRMGRGDLTIDAANKDADSGGQLKTPEQQQAYRNGAMNDIASMMQTESGRREIYQLHNNVSKDENGDTRRGLFGMQMPFNIGPEIHRHTTMVPLLNADGSQRTDNGFSAPDGPGSMRNVNADGTLGKAGTGTDAHIRYNPGVNIWDGDPQAAANTWAGQTRSDVLLAHEMNHAIKQTQGMGDPRAVQAGDNAANPNDPGVKIDADYRDGDGDPLRRIEHQAVGIGLYANDDMTENAYRRERRKMADMNAPGLIEGRPGMGESDRVMVERDTYVGRPAPSAPPPGTGPGGSGSVPARLNHGHDHDN